MTENKRFTIKEFSTLDAMSSLDVICDEGIELPSSTACDLLNELYEENEQLNVQIQRERRASAKQHLKWSKEAERKVSELTELLADEVKKNGELLEENNLLRIENKRLKKL